MPKYELKLTIESDWYIKSNDNITGLPLWLYYIVYFDFIIITW